MSRWFQSYGFAEVAAGLLVGAYPLDQDDVARLAQLHTGRILNLVQDDEYPEGAREIVTAALDQAGIVEERLSTPDYGNLPAPVFDAAVEIVSAWLDEGQLVYLHCRAGWQRSAAVAAAVMATRQQIDLEEALLQIQARKPSADPLPHQREDLELWWRSRGGAGRASG